MENVKRIILVTLLFPLLSHAQSVDTIFTSRPVPDHIFRRMIGKSYKLDCPLAIEELRYLQLSYCDAKGDTRKGELVCNKSIAADLMDIFRQLWKAGYRIERMQLVDDYGADDERSMTANNTSCFNYRTISGTKIISKHGRGMAIDINPLYNPYVKGNKVEPVSGKKWAYNRSKRKDIPYKIDRNDLCYKLFKKHGFRWGGDWPNYKDYQHFEK